MKGKIQVLPVTSVFDELQTSETGLSDRDASERLRQFGANEYAPPSPTRHLRNFARQFTHFLALLLWIAAGLAFMLDHMQPGQGLRALGECL